MRRITIAILLVVLLSALAIVLLKPVGEAVSKPELEWSSDIKPGSGPGQPPPNMPPDADGPWNHRILIACSSDGLSWQKRYTILADQASVPDAIIDKEGNIRVYYCDYFNGGITVAISKDGENWIYKRVKGLSPEWADPDVVILPDGRYRLYASYFPLVGSQDRIVSAISEDGITFTPEEGNRYHEPGTLLADPDVFWAGDHWVMFVDTGGALIMLTSEDGLNFTKIGKLELEVDSGGVSCTIPVEGGYRIYFHRGKPLQIYSAFTSDLKNWSEPVLVLEAGEPGSLDEFGTADPAVVKLPQGGYLMFYKTWINPPKSL